MAGTLCRKTHFSGSSATERSALSPLNTAQLAYSCPPATSTYSPIVRVGAIDSKTANSLVKPKKNLGVENCYKTVDDLHTTEFVWRKKVEKEGLTGLSEKCLQRLQKRKIAENLAEVERLKRQRLERQAKWEAGFEKKEARARKLGAERQAKWENAETEWYRSWEDQEEHFFLQQARLRTEIRLQQSRGKPIDFLAKYTEHLKQYRSSQLSGTCSSNSICLDPEKQVDSLDRPTLEDLSVDVDTYKRIHGMEHQEFWNDMKTIIQNKLNSMGSVRRVGIHRSVMSDVVGIVKGKTFKQLAALTATIKQKLEQGNVDVAYWESLLGEVTVHKAKARTRERYLTHLQQIATVAVDRNDTKSRNIPATPNRCSRETNGTGNICFEDIVSIVGEVEIVDKYSQGLLQEESLPQVIVVLDPDEDSRMLQEARICVLLKHSSNNANDMDVPSGSNLSPLTEGSCTGMSDTSDPELKETNEDVSDEAATQWIQHECHTPCHRVRPCKPRYSNKVFTGYAWNRYNRTHYNSDRPPPKMVMGYSFNVFYPELVDKSKRPRFTITPRSDCEEMAVLTFSAGPPYEDIAFRVVNKVWDKSWKHGYRCTYNGTVLQLSFRFKKCTYRR